MHLGTQITLFCVYPLPTTLYPLPSTLNPLHKRWLVANQIEKLFAGALIFLECT
jgi:hypothetical protein